MSSIFATSLLVTLFTVKLQSKPSRKRLRNTNLSKITIEGSTELGRNSTYVKEIKGTVSRYKHLEVTILKTYSNEAQIVTNDDVVRPQVRTHYIGHEQIAIAYRRMGRSYYLRSS